MKQKYPRILYIFFCSLLFMQHLASVSCAAHEEERRELWTGSLFSSTYRAGICIKDNGDVYGALYLRQANGAVDRYSISGRIDGDRIAARHHSGHEFEGRFISKDRVQGRLTLKSGHKLNVRALRAPEPEVDEYCRLVQQQ